MIATAASKSNKRNCVMIKKLINNKFILEPVFPNRVNSKCPAIILAANRIANVPGRITFLIVSIHTINGIRTAGVPWGTKWANICCVLLIHPNNMNLNHRGRARERVIDMWLVLVKIYGNRPKKLLNTIIANNEIKIKVLPLILSDLIRILNSKWRVLMILNQINLRRLGINQNIVGIRIHPINVLIQFNEIDIILVDGSKEEKRFVIIFN